MTAPIRPGQIYRSCDPSDGGKRIKVVDVSIASYWITHGPGHGKVRIVPLKPDGSRGRPRYVARVDLHATDTTPLGVTRRIGCVLEDGPS